MKKNSFLLYSVIVGIILFGICVYRASTTCLTYDEAFTYLNYVPSNPIMIIRYLIPIHEIIDHYDWFLNPIINKFSFLYVLKIPFETAKELISGRGLIFANNHILNSFLISVVQLISKQYYNEFIIRLPNLIFYIFYLIFAYLLSKKYKHKYLCFNLLVFNYGIHEFFGLARGYGISCSLVLIGLYFFKCWYDNTLKNKYLNISYLLLALSCYANTTSLLIFGSVIIISQYIIISKKGFNEYINYIVNNLIYYIFLSFFTIVIAIYHFRVSNSGLYVYGGEKGFFSDVLVSIWQVYGIKYFPIIITIIILLVIGVIVYIYRKELLKKPIIYCFIVYFIVLIGLTLGCHQLWLTSRLLIPAIPLIMLSIFEIIEVVDINKYVMSGLIVISMIPFIINVDVTKTRDWVDSYGVRDKAMEAYQKKDNSVMEPYLSDYTVYFYQQKILNLYNYDILEGLCVE